MLGWTGERWKVLVSEAVLAAGGALVVILAAIDAPFGLSEGARTLCSSLGAAAAFVLACSLLSTIRCPKCRMSPARWWLEQHAGERRQILTLERCPVCSYRFGEESG
jgi:hypothetical protein